MNTTQSLGLALGLCLAQSACGSGDDVFGQPGDTSSTGTSTSSSGSSATSTSSSSTGSSGGGFGGGDVGGGGAVGGGTEGGGGSGGDSTGPAVSGKAVRSGNLDFTGDGIGTLCVAVTDGCPSMSNNNPTSFVGAQVDQADLSTSQSEVPFTIPVSGLADGAYVVTGFLQEAGGACSTSPTKGDPVAFDFEMGSSPCPTFQVAGGSPVNGTGLVLDFNFTMPF